MTGAIFNIYDAAGKPASRIETDYPVPEQCDTSHYQMSSSSLWTPSEYNIPAVILRNHIGFPKAFRDMYDQTRMGRQMPNMKYIFDSEGEVSSAVEADYPLDRKAKKSDIIFYDSHDMPLKVIDNEEQPSDEDKDIIYGPDERIANDASRTVRCSVMGEEFTYKVVPRRMMPSSFPLAVYYEHKSKPIEYFNEGVTRDAFVYKDDEILISEAIRAALRTPTAYHEHLHSKNLNHPEIYPKELEAMKKADAVSLDNALDVLIYKAIHRKEVLEGPDFREFIADNERNGKGRVFSEPLEKDNIDGWVKLVDGKLVDYTEVSRMVRRDKANDMRIVALDGQPAAYLMEPMELRPHNVSGIIGHSAELLQWMEDDEYLAKWRKDKGYVHSDEVVMHWLNIAREFDINPERRFVYVRGSDYVCSGCNNQDSCEGGDPIHTATANMVDDFMERLLPELEFGKVYDGRYLSEIAPKFLARFKEEDFDKMMKEYEEKTSMFFLGGSGV